ncbi:hypothetical protein JW979_10245 [bacterium]|nr:hypothetical protein [candidate division CSSED10-310 bacterium]
MRCYIVMVSNGPSALITELDTEGTVKNLLRRGYKNFNLYRVPENTLQHTRRAVGEKEWDLVASELNMEWPVRVIERDNAKAFRHFQMYANSLPSAVVIDGEMASEYAEFAD